MSLLTAYGLLDPALADLVPNECYYTQFNTMSSFALDFPALLFFELGNRFTLRAATHQLIPIVVVVVLTIRRGFRDYMPAPFLQSIAIPNLPTSFLRLSVAVGDLPGRWATHEHFLTEN